MQLIHGRQEEVAVNIVMCFCHCAIVVSLACLTTAMIGEAAAFRHLWIV